LRLFLSFFFFFSLFSCFPFDRQIVQSPFSKKKKKVIENNVCFFCFVFPFLLLFFFSSLPSLSPSFA